MQLLEKPITILITAECVIDYSYDCNQPHLLCFPTGEDTDYESWIAHFENSNEEKYKGCLLGIKETFLRLKKDSWWVNLNTPDNNNNLYLYCAI